MEQLLGFVNDLSNERVSTSAEWVELDLVEMFPNIPREKILVAVKHFWAVLCKECHIHPHSSGFHIHKPGIRPLDSISAGGSAYQFFSIHDVLLLLSWDLKFRPLFQCVPANYWTSDRGSDISANIVTYPSLHGVPAGRVRPSPVL